jgi:hypothetical protein
MNARDYLTSINSANGMLWVRRGGWLSLIALKYDNCQLVFEEKCHVDLNVLQCLVSHPVNPFNVCMYAPPFNIHLLQVEEMFGFLPSDTSSEMHADHTVPTTPAGAQAHHRFEVSHYWAYNQLMFARTCRARRLLRHLPPVTSTKSTRVSFPRIC